MLTVKLDALTLQFLLKAQALIFSAQTSYRFIF